MSETTIHPPQAPEFRRRFVLYPYQYIAIPLIFLVPILALLGLFGETGATVSTSNTALSMHVEYTSRIRYTLAAPLTVSITNQTNDAINLLTVHFDRAYLEGFSRASFTPDVTRIENDEYLVELRDIQPGETQMIVIDLQAEKIGLYKGMISVETEETNLLSVEIDSLLFP